ncbi:MAG: energy-coupling factor transporter ATPase [Clostridia bacterium]|nr:energy-coupling factor transporter ATPase [Clostridia bacterium]
MSDTIIKCKNLSFAYIDGEKRKDVLKNIDLEIEQGSFVAVLGHNGSGKSTLAKLINMILVPIDGELSVFDKTITKEGLSENEVFALRQKVGMVFQNPDNQLVATIVEEDVAFGPENLGIEPEEIRRRVDSSLEIVGMEGFKRHSPHQLSGGQKQRVAIAGILAMSPEIIVFDEATAMLDPIGRKEIIETIKKLNREEKKTIILITHYMEEAAQADRVVVLEDGKIVLDGCPKHVFSQTEVLHKTGLDTPQITELMQGLIADGYKFSNDIIDVDEAVSEIVNSIKGNC